MNKILFALITLVFTSLAGAAAHAQSVDVKDIGAGDEESTTIEIKKGKRPVE